MIVCTNSTGNFTVTFRGEVSEPFLASSSLEEVYMLFEMCVDVNTVCLFFLYVL
jgi:hypothetical protein